MKKEGKKIKKEKDNKTKVTVKIFERPRAK